MNRRTTTGPDDRLVDYFAVVGLGDGLDPIDPDTGMPLQAADATPPLELTYRASTLHRFPMVDYDAPAFPTGVGLFCFPDGLKLVHGFPPMPRFFTYVATGGTGTRLYGHCILLYETLTPAQVKSFQDRVDAATAARVAAVAEAAEAAAAMGGPDTPRAMTDSMRLPPRVPIIHEVAEGKVDSPEAATAAGAVPQPPPSPPPAGDTAAAGDTASTAAAADGPAGAGAGDETGAGVVPPPPPPPPSTGDGDVAADGDGASTTSEGKPPEEEGGEGGGGGAEVVTDGLDTIDPTTVYAPKCLVLLSQWCFESFRGYMSALYQLSLSPMQLPIERVIGNFVTEVPLPPAGKVEVQYQIAHTSLTFCRPPPNERLSPMGLPMREIFECLSIQNIIKVMSAILLERQVMFTSCQLSLLTGAAEVLTSLIYPLAWTHVYIPVLPRSLCQVLQAPMPFIVGISRDTYVAVSSTVPTSVIIVDLDRNLVINAGKQPILLLPSKQRNKLVKSLKVCANVFETRPFDWNLSELPHKDSAFKHAMRPSEMPRFHFQSTIDWAETRKAFFKIFTHFLLPYADCLIYPSPEVPYPKERFDKTKFLTVHHKKESSAHPFLEALMDTQAFQNFVDDRIEPDADDADYMFFDEELVAKRGRSWLGKFQTSETPFLDSNDYVISKTKVALSPDVSGLEPDAVFRYGEHFPALAAEMYPEPRYVEPLTDSKDSGGQKVRQLAVVGDALEATGATLDANVFALWFITCSAAIGHRRAIDDSNEVLDAYILPPDEDEANEASRRAAVLAATASFATPTGGGPASVLQSSDLSTSASAAPGGGEASGTTAEGADTTGPDAGTVAAMPRPPRRRSLHRLSSVASGPAAAIEITDADRGWGLEEFLLTRRRRKRADAALAQAAAATEASDTGAAGVAHSDGDGGGDGGCDTDGEGEGGEGDAEGEGAGAGATTNATDGEAAETAAVTGREGSEEAGCDAAATEATVVAPAESVDTSSEAGGSAEDGEDPRSAGLTLSAPAAGGGAGAGAGAGSWVASPRAGRGSFRRRGSLVDVRQQILNTGQQQRLLDVAFAVLDRIQHDGHQMLGVVFRCLIEACGRCGDAEKVVKTMQEAGIAPDSNVYSCMFRALCMDSNNTSATALTQMDWKRFRTAADASNDESKQPSRLKRGFMNLFKRRRATESPRVYGASHPITFGPDGTPIPLPRRRRTHGAGSARSASSRTDSRRLARGHSGSTLGSALGEDDARSVGTHDDLGVGDSVSVASGTTGASGALANGTGADGSSRAGSDAGGTPGSVAGDGKASEGLLLSSIDPSVGEADGGLTTGTPGDISSLRSPSRGRVMSWLRSWRVDSKELAAAMNKGLGPGLGGAADDDGEFEPWDKSSAHALSHRDPGFGVLSRMFPDLKIDTNRETCPKCNEKVVDKQIQAGWRRDPHDYTTRCPYPECCEANGTPVDESKRPSERKKGDPEEEDIDPLEGAVRFVARFAVTSKAPFWEGSTGPGTPLFCEYLPPWVLMKELQKALVVHGEKVVCSTLFRHKYPTIFWNLVWFFERLRLPVDFMVPTEVTQAFEDSLPRGLGIGFGLSSSNRSLALLELSLRGGAESARRAPPPSSGDVNRGEAGIDG